MCTLSHPFIQMYFQHNFAVEALMIENIRNMDNSTDIGFTLGLRFSI
ncbi:hypothetical protein VCR31J2_1310191 [Vibrio coralliirubri]|uniref:Uncharacterized protein n=1 Tax=Vibrio coralliirubri TaxID=1516159 RepID=A0AA86WNH4_9VIBR|nr:hypothetical protein VCR31J2_1310191 [Vibrio coralliirubri]